MYVVLFNVPEEIILDLCESRSDFTDYIKATVAVNLYKNKKVSLCYCAIGSRYDKRRIYTVLGKNEVSIFGFDSHEEFVEELENA